MQDYGEDNVIIITTKTFTVKFETQRSVVPVLRWNYFVDTLKMHYFFFQIVSSKSNFDDFVGEGGARGLFVVIISCTCKCTPLDGSYC